MSDLSKLEKLDKILRHVEKKGISAYSIAQSTKISEAGIGKILNKLSKNPQERTIDVIYKHLFSEIDVKKNDNHFVNEKQAIQKEDFLETDLLSLSQRINLVIKQNAEILDKLNRGVVIDFIESEKKRVLENEKSKKKV